jgi:hypothetical protein
MVKQGDVAKEIKNAETGVGREEKRKEDYGN